MLDSACPSASAGKGQRQLRQYQSRAGTPSSASIPFWAGQSCTCDGEDAASVGHYGHVGVQADGPRGRKRLESDVIGEGVCGGVVDDVRGVVDVSVGNVAGARIASALLLQAQMIFWLSQAP